MALKGDRSALHEGSLDDDEMQDTMLPCPPVTHNAGSIPREDASLSPRPQAASFGGVVVEVPSDETPWKAYSQSFTENSTLPWLPAFLYRFRWILMNRNPLCWYVWRGHTTVGDVLVFLTVWALVVKQAICVHAVFFTGTYASISLLFVFFFAMHNNQILLLVTGMSFERALFWHKVFAVATVAHGLVHALSFYANGRAAGVRDSENDHHFLSVNRVPGMEYSGWVMLVSMALMCVSGIGRIRRTLFAVFYRLHVVLAFVVVVGALFHGSGAAAWDGRVPIGILGGCVWLVDLTIRVLYMNLLRLPSQVKLHVVSKGTPTVVRASWPRRTVSYSAGQWVFICVPKLGLLHWHPFTVSSAPHDKDMTLHFAAVGPWTQRVAALASNEGCEVTAYVEGPYGAPMIDVHRVRFRSFLVIAGGMGVTYARAWKRQLLHDVSRGRDIAILRVVWSLRASQAHLLNELGGWEGESLQTYDGTDITEHIYLTGKDAENSLPDDLAARLHRDERGSAKGGNGAAKFSAHSEDGMRPILDVPLRQCLHCGRPPYEDLFEEIAQDMARMGESRVAVMVCGPEAIVNICRRLCKEYSTQDVTFEPHWETFEF